MPLSCKLPIRRLESTSGCLRAEIHQPLDNADNQYIGEFLRGISTQKEPLSPLQPELSTTTNSVQNPINDLH